MPTREEPDDSAGELIEGAARMGVALTAADAARLLALAAELASWNRHYNLTAIDTPRQMLTHHLLDSLSIHSDLAGARIADVGTGAGFPGLPLAVCNPQRQFTLIDSTAKKLRFVSHAAALLGLTNTTVLHARVESLAVAQPFDTVVSRAFAAIPLMLQRVAPLAGPQTRVLAMKGRLPREELQRLPDGWRLIATRELGVPGLDAARCVLRFARAPQAAAP
ncbi:MAG: 16S rRNA (guanine(527)-N(7))-methyltransferase RsmG [Proteobacteria bacterium]|nr:16S rRNA (guanine(527)-N(7))-methyltransferase RsmG [Pseudomonadota bacterium]